MITVNADDFGYSHEVNEAICRAFREGIITRTTWMANMPAAAEAMEMARREGFADRVGLHLNITEGVPLTKPILSDPLLCEDGRFHASFYRKLLYRLYLKRNSRAIITEEFRAQLKAYEEAGGTLWHVDSHHHVHTDLSVLCAMHPLFAEFPIKSIRLGRNLYHGGNILMRLYKLFLNRILKKRCLQSHPVYFGSIKDLEAYTAKSYPRGDVEIMVHPKYVNGEWVDTDIPMEYVRNVLENVN